METRTPGSEGGPGKRAGRKANTAPWPDPTRPRPDSAGYSLRILSRGPRDEEAPLEQAALILSQLVVIKSGPPSSLPERELAGSGSTA